MKSGERVGGGWWRRLRRWRCRRGWRWRGGDAGGDGGWGHGGDDGGEGGGGRGDDGDDSTCVWVVRPYPLLPPIPIVVLRGGMERTTTALATAFEGSRVRGFGGSRFDPGPHPEGIIGPGGLVTSKCSSPEATWEKRGKFGGALIPNMGRDPPSQNTRAEVLDCWLVL